MKNYLFIWFFLFLSVPQLFATHNRAGEITFEHISNLTYKIIVTTYTKESSADADRCEVIIYYGDGDMDTIPRVNNNALATCVGCINCGESLGNDIKMNRYEAIHTYTGPGLYTTSVTDPNRNGDILNVPNSINIQFYIETELVIFAGLGHNNSPVLTNPPIDIGCSGSIFEHNPGAYDPDGDSLSYSFVTCMRENGDPIAGFSNPNNVNNCQGGSLTLNPITGTVIWDFPDCQGEYNLCLLIEEWRLDTASGNRYKIGSILRDMQITIEKNCNNIPPVIADQLPLCVTAGDTIDKVITSTDPDGDAITLSATGEPFTLNNSPAAFNTVTDTGMVSENFFWPTNCSHVRKQLYQAVLRAEDDNGNPNLVNYKTFSINVIAPAPQDPSATPQGNNIQLQWTPSVCEASCYKVYRKLNTTAWEPDICETGVPSYTGYSLIAHINGSVSSYTDDNGGSGLIHGQLYCYRVVACYPDHAESYASEEFCAQLIKDVPVITRVSVNFTDSVYGSDTITWSMPTELDTMEQHPGPYQYVIFRSPGFDSALVEIGATSVSAYLAQTDTFFVDDPLNTKNQPNAYVVELYSNDILVGSTHTASSVYLSSLPSDNTLTLSWEENVPWTNHRYVVFKYDSSSNNYLVLDTIETATYKDTGLVNDKSYCYFVRSIGSYSGTGFIDPILNNSQIHCGIPIDTTPPCAPDNIIINKDCDYFENELSWSNPNNFCADDVVGYTVLHAPVLGQELKPIASVNPDTETSFFHSDLGSIAGCYAIIALDKGGNKSQSSEKVCVDNCPEYELPNVFTPGGDGHNDLFVPFPYRFVESIHLQVFNRWGQLVFETEDPDVLWDGTNIFTNQNCVTGAYFYLCQVNEIRLSGIEPRMIKGQVQLIREDRASKPPGN